MLEARAKIPTARMVPTQATTRRSIIAARARRALSIAGALSVHLARASIVMLGFGAMVWFASESSRSTHTRLETDRPQHPRTLELAPKAPLGYDIHRIHLYELMRLAEDIHRPTK